jgi:hypothetical protein
MVEEMIGSRVPAALLTRYKTDGALFIEELTKSLLSRSPRRRRRRREPGHRPARDPLHAAGPLAARLDRLGPADGPAGGGPGQGVSELLGC